MSALETEARKRAGNIPDIEFQRFTGRNRDRVTVRGHTPEAEAALKKAFGR